MILTEFRGLKHLRLTVYVSFKVSPPQEIDQFSVIILKFMVDLEILA